MNWTVDDSEPRSKYRLRKHVPVDAAGLIGSQFCFKQIKLRKNLGPEKHRLRTVQEKIAIVQQSFEPGMSASVVVRQQGLTASKLFLWRKQYLEDSLDAVAAGEQVVPASELASAMKQPKELQCLQGKKKMELNYLKKLSILAAKKSG